MASDWTQKLKLPAGFKIEKVIQVLGARQMALSPKGTLYVGTMDQGVVYAITPDGKVSTMFEKLNMPQGVLWHNNELYVSEIQRVSKVKNLETKPELETVKDFPDKKWHGWKTLGEGLVMCVKRNFPSWPFTAWTLMARISKPSLKELEILSATLGILILKSCILRKWAGISWGTTFPRMKSM